MDFETSSDQPKTTNVTEVGATLIEYETQERWHYSARLSQLCYSPDYPPQTEKIIKITKITDDMLKSNGKPVKDVFREQLFPLLEQADVVFCHKVSFDKTVLDAVSKRHGLTPPEKEYVCTLSNFPWPEEITCKKLSHIAYEHSIYVDPATLHRAVADTDLMMSLVLSKYDLNDVLEYARKPWVYLRAFTIEPWKDASVQVDIAKQLGFNWQQCKYVDEPKFPKMWVMRVKQDKVAEVLKKVEESASPFRVTPIEGMY